MNKAPKKENLKPFQKGESGNPSGRPVGSRNVSTVLRELLEKQAPDSVIELKEIKEFFKKKKITIADAAAARILYEALINGESWALKEISDRTEGKPAQSVDIGNKDDKPFKTEEQNNLNKLRKLSTEDLLKLKEINEKLNAS